MFLENYLIDPRDYIEEEKISEGSFGSVLLVHPKNEKSQKIAAKKIPSNLADQDAYKSFIHEVSIMTNLNHPNLIKLVGFHIPSDKNQNYIIYSKYLKNNNLLDVLKKDEFNNKKEKILNETKLSKIVYGIASAMAYLHAKNIIHCDLKPENILLDENYSPVLADFGLSRYIKDDMTMTDCIGTPYFMAPEMLEEDNIITNKIDVYSFAITMLSLFTTKYRFEGRQPRSINQLANAIIKGKRYRIPDNVPDFYVSLIQRCWSNDKNERPSFNAIVKQFDDHDDFIFDGADINEVHEYMNQIKNYNDLSKINKE